MMEVSIFFYFHVSHHTHHLPHPLRSLGSPDFSPEVISIVMDISHPIGRRSPHSGSCGQVRGPHRSGGGADHRHSAGAPGRRSDRDRDVSTSAEQDGSEPRTSPPERGRLQQIGDGHIGEPGVCFCNKNSQGVGSRKIAKVTDSYLFYYYYFYNYYPDLRIE